MAEGLFDGVVGGVDEESTLAKPPGAEAFAAAVAANLANHSPEVATETAEFLREQTELLRAQRKSVEAEHKFFKEQWAPRLLGIRLRTAFQVFIALVATVIGIGVAVMIHDAVTSRSVVVEPFDAPPKLAERGLTGKVIAGGLLDELVRLQTATRTTAEKRSLSNAWTSDIKLAVPEAGISLSEVARALKARFGHDLHINGELVGTEADGLLLTVRGDGVLAKSFAGGGSDLQKLTIAAAEYVYSQSEPALWITYLSGTGRDAEAIAFGRDTYASADKADRPYLLNYWANSLTFVGGSNSEALSLYRAAIKEKPDFWVGYSNVMNALWITGDEEGAWRAGQELRKAAGGRPGRASEEMFQNADTLNWNLPAWRASLVADVDSHGGLGTASNSQWPVIADVDIRLHDTTSAQLALETTKENEHDPTIGAMMHFVKGRLAAETGDAAQAAREMEAFATAFANPDVRSNFPGYECWVAPAEEAAGHPEKADAVLKTAGTYVDCYRFRADIIDHRGDWPGAQDAYQQAVALAPDLPAAYYSWGLALARHGELAGAAARLKDANDRAGTWADPLKSWGDVLAKQGRLQEALAKYDAALKYAPQWGALKEARRAAAKRLVP
jgi:tetratricopeptide (TPR) repeat protein